MVAVRPRNFWQASDFSQKECACAQCKQLTASQEDSLTKQK